MPSSTDGNHSHISPVSSNFSIAITGGGIGGLSAALALAAYNPTLRANNVAVYEQASTYGEIGAGVAIGIQAARALQKLGVWEAADSISGHRSNVHRSNRRWDNDDLVVDAPAANSDGDIRQLWVHRAEFLEVLHNEIKKKGYAKLETNKKVVKIEDCDSTVRIIFADGTTALANLVIACDGIHSTVRSQFTIDRPVYSGRIAFRGLVPMSAIASNWPYSSWTLSWLAPNKHFLVFPISQNRLLNVVAFVAKKESELGGLKESWKASAPRSQLEKEYAGWNNTVQRIIQAIPLNISEWKINDRELLSEWCYMGGKVVLSGDAAHAMVPQQGSGAGLSIEDANVLGLAIRDYLANPEVGLSAYTSLYQETRLPRAQKAQVTSRQAAEVYDMQGSDFEGLSFEECLLVVKEKVSNRMAWVWNSNLEADYAAAKARTNLP
ncbi:hypothetical protein OIDMADRAFT_30752 [Oidiodendron maius Zn]|uniref:FAD-binding domain-containing protein n=1 Tax=Oidiodendron maius (strain Zn) TaxID=913774 RepID=A0A0C3DB24_OIDMZ|nr:hypothetical protein OIDMADRAFT_30752 [Oidiodendron maius Zn]